MWFVFYYVVVGFGLGNGVVCEEGSVCDSVGFKYSQLYDVILCCRDYYQK